MATLSTDTFQRANQAGFGTASDGEVWNAAVGGPVLTINANKGRWGVNGGSSYVILGSQITGSINHLARWYIEGATDFVGAVFRATDSNNYYRMIFTGTGIELDKVVAGTPTQLAQAAKSLSSSSNATIGYWVRVIAQGTTIQGRIWLDGNSEPSTWDINTIDATYSSGKYGCFANLFSTGADVDSLTVTVPVNPSITTTTAYGRDGKIIASSRDGLVTAKGR